MTTQDTLSNLCEAIDTADDEALETHAAALMTALDRGDCAAVSLKQLRSLCDFIYYTLRAAKEN